MNEEIVSVIIPVYNAEKYLRRCLDSVKNQTYKNIEVILVDDGSTDSSPQICDEYVVEDPRFHVIHKENGGVSSARNAGLRYCAENTKKEGYIGFIDADDYISKQYIEVLYNLIKTHDASISACPNLITGAKCCLTDAKRKQCKIRIKKYRFNKWYSGYSVWGKLYSKEIILTEPLLCFSQDMNVAEDIDFLVYAIKRADKGYVATTQPLYYYERSNETSITHTCNPKYFEYWQYFLDRAKKTLSGNAGAYRSLYVLSGCYLSYIKMFWEAGTPTSDVTYRNALHTIRKQIPKILFSPAPVDVKIKLLLVAFFPEYYRKKRGNSL